MEIAFRYSQFLVRGGNDAFPEIKLLNDGNAKVANYLRVKLRTEDIKVALARIVYVASVLLQGKAGKLVKQVDMDAVKDLAFPDRFKILERLKGAVPEAYFYWAMAVAMKQPDISKIEEGKKNKKEHYP